MSKDQFAESKKVLRWARKQLDNLVEAGRTFLETDPYQFVEYLDPLTNDILLKFRILKATPDEVEEGAYRVLGDLRNALDQACHAASLTLGSNDPDRTNFPMAGSLKELRSQLAAKKGPYRGVPVALHPKLIEFAPFWAGADGGNNLLRSLGDMANPNKHRTPVRTGVDTMGVGIRTMVGIARAEVMFEWNALKSEVTVMRLTRDGTGQSRYDINLKAAHAFAEGPLRGEPVTNVLRDMLAMVQSIVEALSAETARLQRRA